MSKTIAAASENLKEAFNVLQSLAYTDECDFQSENPNSLAIVANLRAKLKSSLDDNDELNIELFEETLQWYDVVYGIFGKQPYQAITILINNELREDVIKALLDNADKSSDNDYIENNEYVVEMLRYWEVVYPEAKAEIVFTLIATYEEALGVEFYDTPMPPHSFLN